MNYLAHLLLAGEDPELRIGGVIADFVRGPALVECSPGVRRGVALHRKIDAFTDAHPVARRSRGRTAASRRRYAGILVDVFYDHFLAVEWDRYSAVSLPAFAAEAYALLADRRDALPEGMLRVAERMVAEDWLCGYRGVERVERALARLSRRISRENDLGARGEDLRAHYAELQADFRAFFPELQQYARSFIETGVPEPAGAA